MDQAMQGASTETKLLDEAIDLMIRHHNDPANPVAVRMIEAWKGRSPQHGRVWARVERLHGAAGTALAQNKQERGPGIDRRKMLLGSFAAAGLIGTGAALFPALRLRARADHITATAEVRRVDLPDGSVATLGPRSAIALEFERGERRVALLEGMGFFEVAQGREQPFTVQCDAFQALSWGASFDISREANALMLAVDHGQAWAQAAGLGFDRTLSAGDWLSLDAAGMVEEGKRERAQIASWRDRVLIADREPVSVLVARIGRWLPGEVVVAAPGIGTQRVSGVYDLSDPLRALEAVVHPAGGRVRQLSSLLTVVSPV